MIACTHDRRVLTLIFGCEKWPDPLGSVIDPIMGEGFDAQAVRFFSEADRIANIDDAAVFTMVVERTEVLEIGMLM